MDGWNVITEHQTHLKRCLASLTGGIGGLLNSTHNISPTKNEEQRTSNFFHYDSNGNIILLTNATAQASARYTYDAFSQTMTATGIAADLNRYRFSTKPIESGSGLAYYGYRYYDPVSGRWTTKDPIGERGGINLLLAINNDCINEYDPDGRMLGYAFARFISSIVNAVVDCSEYDYHQCIGCCEMMSVLKMGTMGMGAIVEIGEIVAGSPVTGCVGLVATALEIYNEFNEGEKCKDSCSGVNPIP